MDIESWINEKIIHPETIGKHLRDLKNKGKSIVTINGAFDLLHKGHLHILFEAKKQGDILVVALNTDACIKRSKGANRPVKTLQDRLAMLSAVRWVDFVTWFTQDDPRDFLKVARPDVHVNGSEYGPKCLEAQMLKQIGAKLHIVDLVAGLSTTNIVKKMEPCG